MLEALKQLVAEHQIVKEPVCAVIYGSEVSNAVTDYAEAEQAETIVLGVRRTIWTTAHLPPHLTCGIIARSRCPVLAISF